jgi:hypothetical protein
MKSVILITKTGLGTVSPGDEQFGTEMLDKFFHTLESRERKPDAICFYTEGAKVVCEGSPHVLTLKLLEGLGVRLVTCQTCLQYYGVADQVAVGGTGGMAEIVELIESADNVVTV